MTEALWQLFKFLISTACILVAAALTFFVFKFHENFEVLGLAGVFVFFVVLLWTDLTKPSRALTFVGFIFGCSCVALPFLVLTGVTVYPQICLGGIFKTMFCEFENALYALGGRPAVSIPSFILAGIVVYGLVIGLKRSQVKKAR